MVDESQIANSVQTFRTKYEGLSKGTQFIEYMSGDEPNLILLPQFLSRVSDDAL